MSSIIVYSDIQSLTDDIPYRFFNLMRENLNLRRPFQKTFYFKIKDQKGHYTISGPAPEISISDVDVKLTGDEMWERAQAYVEKHSRSMDPFEAMFSKMRM